MSTPNSQPPTANSQLSTSKTPTTNIGELGVGRFVFRRSMGTMFANVLKRRGRWGRRDEWAIRRSQANRAPASGLTIDHIFKHASHERQEPRRTRCECHAGRPAERPDGLWRERPPLSQSQSAVHGRLVSAGTALSMPRDARHGVALRCSVSLALSGDRAARVASLRARAISALKSLRVLRVEKTSECRLDSLISYVEVEIRSRELIVGS